MAAIPTGIGQQSTGELRMIDEIAIEQVTRFCSACDRFAKVQYEKMLKGDPTPEQLEENRKHLRWMLRLAHLILSLADDPEFPDKELKGKVEFEIRRLKEYWSLLYDPPSGKETEELDTLLAEIFPDEPRA